MEPWPAFMASTYHDLVCVLMIVLQNNHKHNLPSYVYFTVFVIYLSFFYFVHGLGKE